MSLSTLVVAPNAQLLRKLDFSPQASAAAARHAPALRTGPEPAASAPGACRRRPGLLPRGWMQGCTGTPSEEAVGCLRCIHGPEGISTWPAQWMV
jgi:hypothetical protein